MNGAKRKEESWDQEENGTIVLKDDVDREKLETNAIFKLEHLETDKKKAESNKSSLLELQDLNDRLWSDPYSQSRQLRKRFREDKKIRMEVEKNSNALKDKHSLSIPILPPSISDEKQAGLVKFKFAPPKKDDLGFVKKKKEEIQLQPIFKIKGHVGIESALKKRLIKPADSFAVGSILSVKKVKVMKTSPKKTSQAAWGILDNEESQNIEAPLVEQYKDSGDESN
ncbi:hypothetical protein HK096_010791 [Nowakowskiella sp. JEL0078]|nr:hypothetical protein HK096_010791 [Nowakowskiella sp. JEL0078]